MKKIVASLLFVFALAGMLKAQDLPINQATEKVTFMEVVDAQGLSSQELYKVLKEFALAKGFKVSEEKEAEGEIAFDASIPVEYLRVKGKTEKSTVTYKLHLMAKDGKYRFIGVDYVHVGSDETVTGGKLEEANPKCGPSISAANWIFIKKMTKTEMDKFVEELKKKVKAVQNDPTKNKDW